MKQSIGVLLMVTILISCKAKQENDSAAGAATAAQPQAAKKAFFPVTDFFKGQLTEFETLGLTPLQFNVNGDKKDSVWLKKEAYTKAFGDFLNPVIDSAKLYEYFEEKSFLDQTLNAVTLSYDPVKPLPDSFSFTRWDIYIDPETNKVRKVYLVKKINNNSQRQLTWQTGKQCRAITVTDDGNGKIKTSDEVIIKWNPE